MSTKRCDTYISEHQVKNISFLGHKDNPWAEVTEQILRYFRLRWNLWLSLYWSDYEWPSDHFVGQSWSSIAYEIFEGQLHSSGNIESWLIRCYCLGKLWGIKRARRWPILVKSRALHSSECLPNLLDKIENTEIYKSNSLRHVKCLLDKFTFSTGKLFSYAKWKINCFLEEDLKQTKGQVQPRLYLSFCIIQTPRKWYNRMDCGKSWMVGNHET